MKIGSAIKSARIRAGFTQIQLAQSSEITQTYLSQIENNVKEPNISTLKNIAKNLNVPLPVLFYLSIEEADIDPMKRNAFKLINEPVKSLINEFFNLNT